VNRFFWVACQLDQLCRVRTRIGLDMLQSLPRGLECTYKRILSKVHESDKLHAYRILRFVMFASRPLDLSELVEAIALEENSLSLEDVESRKLCRPDDIFEICGSLIRYSESTGSIRLAHHSIREFLGSPMAGSGVPNEYFISETESYVLLAKTCVTYLNLNDFSSKEFPIYHEGEKHDLAKEKTPPEGDISDHSFLEYAALNCLSHLAQLEAETLEILWPLLRKLFDLRRGNFLYWTSVLRYRHGEFKYPRSIKPLHVCAIHDLEDIAARLISEGHSCNDETIDGRTALHIALENGNNATAELLVANGAAVDAISIGGRRPLHLAIESGNERAVSVLVRARADVNARLPNGDFPLSIAIENSWHVLVSIFLTKADTTLRLADGRSVLHLAAEVGSEIITRKLLDHRLKPNEKDENGWTPLHFSAHYGNSGVTKLLLLRDADGPTGDKNGWTPLHSAIYRRKLDCAAILLTASLDRTRRRSRPTDPILSGGLNADLLNWNISPLQPSPSNDRAGDNMMHPALSSSSETLFDSRNSSEGRRVGVDGRYTFTRHPPRRISSTGGLGSSVNAAPSRSNLELDSDNSLEPFDAGSSRPRLTVGGKYSLDARQEPRTPRRGVSTPSAGMGSSARSEIGNIRMPTPLFLAVSDNFIAGVKLLLENSPDLSDIIECIDVALLQTEFSILELLLRKSGVDNIRYCLKKVGGNGLERARLLCLRALHKHSNDNNPFTAAVKSQDNKILSLLLQEQLPEEISCLRNGCPETVFGGNTQAIELLAEYGVDISTQDSREQTALHRAVIGRNDAAVKFLVEIGVNATTQDENGYTALYWAVEMDNVYATRLLCDYENSSLPAVKKGVSKTTLQLAVEYRNKKVAQVLLERGASLAALDVAKVNTLLHWIIESRNQVVLETLLRRGADVAATNEVGKTALQLALEHGNKEAARVLLTRGATVGAMDNANKLLRRIVESNDEALVKLLLEQGATTNKARQTVLQLAIESEKVEIVVMLLKERAKVVKTNEVGKTILRLALKKQSLELVRLLLEKGQEIEVEDELGKSILELAMRKRNLALVKLILEKGRSAGRTGEVENAMLSLAVEIGDAAQVELLLNSGIKPTAKTSAGGQTALYIALKSRNESLVALLLRHGADVVAADGLGKTALHWAATFGGEAIALMLLNRGADIKAIDNEGMTPVQIATQGGLSNIAELLVKWERNHKEG
jgi:ankyrin repeat protein